MALLLGLPAQKGLRVPKGHKDPRVFREKLVRRVLQDRKDLPDQPEPRDRKDRRDHKVFREFKAKLVPLAQPAQKARKAPPALLLPPHPSFTTPPPKLLV
jgi:hypothetical protein